MKAWFVWNGTPYFDWGDYVHGETAAKAKAMFMKAWHSETEWVYLRPRRCKELDNKPITRDTISSIRDENTMWFPICDCAICKKGTEQ